MQSYTTVKEYQAAELLDASTYFLTKCKNSPAGYMLKHLEPNQPDAVVGITSKRNHLDQNDVLVYDM